MNNWGSENLREELLRLLEIPSESGSEETVLQYLEKRLQFLELPMLRQEVAPAGSNLVLNPLPEPQLLLDAHVDTVPSCIEGKKCELRTEGKLVFGRGAADVKGGTAALIIALEKLKRAKKDLSKWPVTIVFTIDEEQGGTGSAAAAAHFRPTEVIALEPTNLTICPVEAGSLTVKILVTGTPAHGSEMEAGDNAITKAFTVLKKLKKLPIFDQEHPLLGKSGFNIQKICGGSTELVVPQKCELIVDFRVLPEQDIEEVKKTLHTFFDKEEVKWEIIDTSPPFAVSHDLRVIKKLQKGAKTALGRPLELGGFKSWSDAENFVAAGFPAIVFGPGNLAVAHTPFEHIDLEEVKQATNILYHLFCDYLESTIKKNSSDKNTC